MRAPLGRALLRRPSRARPPSWPELGEQVVEKPSTRGFADVEHGFESVRSSVIRIGYLGAFRRGRVEVPQQVDLAKRFGVGCQSVQVAEILVVGSQYVIEPFEKAGRELLSSTFERVTAP